MHIRNSACLAYSTTSGATPTPLNTPWCSTSLKCAPRALQPGQTMCKMSVIWHERAPRNQFVCNFKIMYHNVQLHGLSGRGHPSLSVHSTEDVKKLRLCPDQPSISPACSLCHAILDFTEHVLVTCVATSSVRSRLLPELLNTISKVKPISGILGNNASAEVMTQFLLDCSSFNIPDSVRIPVHNPGTSEDDTLNIFTVTHQLTREQLSLSPNRGKYCSCRVPLLKYV